VLCAVGPCEGDYLPPTTFFEYDPIANTLTELSELPDSLRDTNKNYAPYQGRFLLLPSGEVMFVNCTQDIWFYNPDDAPNPKWAPAITHVPTALAQGGRYPLEGTQLNGLSQACAYGDDVSLATNYPLVRLTSAAKKEITFCRTFGHFTMAVATGSKPVSTNFEVPSKLTPGSYLLAVVANGIASKEVTVNVAATGVAVASASPAVPIKEMEMVQPTNLQGQPQASTLQRFGTGKGFVGVLLLLAAFAGNVAWAPTHLLGSWLVTLGAVAVSLALIGLSGGRWEATFIDNRNRMSLSKLQVILWTVAILSSIVSASCFNAGSLGDVTKIIGVEIDPTLWALLGIPITSAIGTVLALSGKGSRTESQQELEETRKNLQATTGVPEQNIQNNGHVLTKANLRDARWSDLVRGDDVGNGDTIDFSKVQQLYFTLLTLLIFWACISAGIHRQICDRD
jgi:uncharacterized protein (TIGR03437 family)